MGARRERKLVGGNMSESAGLGPHRLFGFKSYFIIQVLNYCTILLINSTVIDENLVYLMALSL